ncbi:uncharacterized protein C8Q71DRAFT_862423 [Rhodofomes roseus]|uniref:ABC transporter domain-containing protein n=1 Tax=Rhodofomes roseus TaxID=34475 RepID=A0ABQ8K129_9APHY|nr:uncharacterized protein C8Q71DRAFT_862423 [Rhodofomes roseus]KAH9830408.1 hypothetical protein C8Q71DRAFT_862423 [Rhodofomes roseus]
MGGTLFWRQLSVLVWKNFIVLSKHPWLNIVRCLLLPIGYAVFLSAAQFFLHKPNNFGLGTSTPVPRLLEQYDGSLPLVWVDGTNGSGTPSADAIMNQVMLPFNSKQRANVKLVASPEEVPSACPENFIGLSRCYSVIVFNFLPTAGDPDSVKQVLNYTLRADSGLSFIDVVKHTSSVEERLMPLQWAVDSAYIELVTGSTPYRPYEWPFTQTDNTEQYTAIRLSYLRGTRMILVIAHFIAFVGIAYQLPGAFAGERAYLLTSHMKAMGLMDSARITSWHFSMSLVNLPGWIAVAVIWRFRIFTATNVGITLLIHILLGLILASWSFFIATPFGKSPQLAAIVSAVVACILAIVTLVIGNVSNVLAVIITLAFPPGFYIFAIRSVVGFELHQVGANLVKGDPDNNVMLLPIIIAAIADIFIWPCLAVILESWLYDAKNLSKSWKRKHSTAEERAPLIPPDVAISMKHLGKDFKTSRFMGRKTIVSAVEDLSLDIPKTGIFVLLGSNGAGKSTTMSILAGLLGRTRGSVTFEGGVDRPPLGTIGLVPQKNVLFPELTCYQTLRLWKAIKPPRDGVSDDEDIEQLLRDCDLGKKIHYNASALSGGQKRKLQLAIGMVGGAQILLVDECTSGVDPLSRRALWKILSSVRYDRTVVFTTHFLDEADLLGDTVAVLAAPGRLVAQGTPVALKSRYGDGYNVQVSFDTEQPLEKPSSDASQLLDVIRPFAPSAYAVSAGLAEVTYFLQTKDPWVVHKVLEVIQQEHEAGRLGSYSVANTSMEDVFLTLMNANQSFSPDFHPKSLDGSTFSTHDSTLKSNSDFSQKAHLRSSSYSSVSLPMLSYEKTSELNLTNGRRKSVFGQALTIFYKRFLIARRSWLSPVLMILITAAGASIPLWFMSGLAAPTCVQPLKTVYPTQLYVPWSPLVSLMSSKIPGKRVLQYPPGLIETLGPSFGGIPVHNFQDNASFVNYVNQNYRNLSMGGVSLDYDTGATLIAWEATPPGLTGLSLLNLASNLLYDHALNETNTVATRVIAANYEKLAGFDSGILVMLKFMAFFGAALSVFPAFFGLYVSKERRSAVQAMQFSNGLSNPAGLWLGHLMFDSIFAVFIATLIIVIYAFASNQFAALPFFWLVLVLYGIVGALFSYTISLAVPSPLAAFAATAGYQAVMFLLYLAGFLLTATYATVTSESRDLTFIHFFVAILSPIANAVHAAFVSLNLFSLLCTNAPATAASEAMPSRFGGPIIYLFVYLFVLFGILVWVDSGAILPRKKTAKAATSAFVRRFSRKSFQASKHGVYEEAMKVATSDDTLRVLNVVKAYGSPNNRVVDNASFGVSQNTVLALLGPNGAGKTTTFNMIRGDVIPDSGDVLINGISVVKNPRTARLALGVCPQFTAIDSELTVREHLVVYGRLKGLKPGVELERNVEALLHGTSLHQYADRLAARLSGGNQRKLALAIALMGNPAVVLIDEFSSGVDAKMKRDMWDTLRSVAGGKAIVITTHSMEEASALATKVGILAKKMLAVGTTETLAERYATYEVHFSCRTRDEIVRARILMSQLPGARMADDVATRFEVPIDDGMSLARLFGVLSSQDELTEFSIEKAGLESVFLKVIRENAIQEEDSRTSKGRWWRIC